MDKLPFYNDTVNLNDLWYQSHRNLLEKIVVELNATDKVEYLSEKFLGEQQKMAKLKDPAKPKRAKTSFLYFCDEERPKVMSEHPELKLGQVMKELGKRWKAVTDKSKYDLLHKKDKERYIEEMEEYEQ